MGEHMKKIPAVFYRTDSGREPVREWLKALSRDDRRRVGTDIQKVEFGWPIGLPVCRSLRDGVWEVRSDLANGRTARTLFCVTHGTMVLLHAFIKKTQRTPPRDLTIALQRKKEVDP